MRHIKHSVLAKKFKIQTSRFHISLSAIAAMSMDSVQFYYPPSEKSSHTNQRRQRDWQHKSFGAVPALAHFTPEARDCNCVLAYNVDNLGDHLLPPEEVF